MKKIVLASVLAAAAISSMNAANAATAGQVCSGPTTASNGSFTVDTSATNEFVKVAFTPKCSANVIMQYSSNATSLGVVAASGKGKTLFGGGTNGGGVSVVNLCSGTNNACSTSDVTEAAATTKRDAS